MTSFIRRRNCVRLTNPGPIDIPCCPLSSIQLPGLLAWSPHSTCSVVFCLIFAYESIYSLLSINDFCIALSNGYLHSITFKLLCPNRIRMDWLCVLCYYYAYIIIMLVYSHLYFYFILYNCRVYECCYLCLLL